MGQFEILAQRRACAYTLDSRTLRDTHVTCVFRRIAIASAGCVACVGTIASAGTATEPSLREMGRVVPVVLEPGRSGYGIADFDGDGMDDITVGSWAGYSNVTGLLKVYGARQRNFGVKQALILEDQPLSRVLAWTDTGGNAHLLTISTDGTATVWSDWPLQSANTFSVQDNVNSAAIADVDLDGQLELVTITDDTLTVNDLAGGTFEWSADFGGNDVAVAQTDADLPLELIVAGMPGVVVDGFSHSVEWSYLDGFGTHVAAGAISPGGAIGFVAARGRRLTVFQSNPWSPVWDVGQVEITAVAIADVENDGQAEIMAANNQNGRVEVYDSLTRDLRILIATGSGTLRSLGVIDLLGDGRPLVAFGGGACGALCLADPLTGAIVTDLPHNPWGPYSAVAIGDLDTAEGFEMAYGARGSVTVVAMSTGEIKWRSPISEFGTEPLELVPTSLRQSGTRLVLAGQPMGYSESARVVMVDTQTHAVVWQVGSNAEECLQDREIRDAAMWDLDGDMIDDVVVSTEANNSGAQGVKLCAFSGTDGTLLWESIVMADGYTDSLGVFVGDTGFGAGPEMVAVLPNSLRAFNVQTHLLDWTLPVSADGASLILSGVAGIELAVFQAQSLHLYDGATHSLLRSLVLNGDITAARALGDIHHLLLAAAGHLVIVDGTSGAVLATTEYLGENLGGGNELAAKQVAPGSWVIGAGSDVGVFRYRFDSSEHIFANGFDVSP